MTDKKRFNNDANFKITILRISNRLRSSKSNQNLTENTNMERNNNNNILIINNNQERHFYNSDKNMPFVKKLDMKNSKENEIKKINVNRKRESSVIARGKIISRIRNQEVESKYIKNEENEDNQIINNNDTIIINKKDPENNYNLTYLPRRRKYKKSKNMKEIEIILPREEKSHEKMRKSKEFNNSSDQINNKYYNSFSSNNSAKKNSNYLNSKYCSYYSTKLFFNPLKSKQRTVKNINLIDINKSIEDFTNHINANSSNLYKSVKIIKNEKNITPFDEEENPEKNNKKTYRKYYNQNNHENENSKNKIKSSIIVIPKTNFEKQDLLKTDYDSVSLSKKINNKTNSYYKYRKPTIECKNNDNNFITNFFEELIEISESLEIKNLLGILLNNFNIKYFINYNNLSFPEDNTNFEFLFKHYSIILVTFIFLSYDNALYILDNVKQVKNLFNQIIYSSLNNLNINYESNKISKFQKQNISKEISQNHKSTGLIIKIIFENNKEYLSLQNALNQLFNKIVLSDYKWFINTINNTILFCFNNRHKFSYNFNIFKQKSVNVSQNNSNSNTKLKNGDSTPKTPYIKSIMKKNFCLVLDIDETIAHSIKLSFGYYFLLRPGTIEFLNEIANYYEIIIFTSSPKSYADNILNKIDSNKNLISHRLYRDHVTYENGQSVKKLKMIGRDLKKTIFVDNLKSNAKDNPKNLYPISTWYSDVYDQQLFKLKEKLIYIATCGKYVDDITKAI